MLKFFLTIVSLILFVLAQAQELSLEKLDSKYISRKGKMYLYFGWNRSAYTTSDIHFRGPGYNFELNNVVAHDRPTKFDPLVYLNPLKMTIPQYQYRFGYYINDKYSISWGFNHMKYVMDANQTVKITGVINKMEAGVYNGTYKNQDIRLTKDFLQFEHTNGLNYLDFNIDRIETLWVSKSKRASLSGVGGFGIGILYPKSDVTLFGLRKDKWHLSGYGVSSFIALRLEFWKYMFIQTQFEGGYINMPDIITTGEFHARAKQSFLYGEGTVMIGRYIQLFNTKKD